MADYPNSIYDPRTKENAEGVEYDAEETTKLFAEDVTKLDDEVKATQTELGTNAKGTFDSVKEWLEALFKKEDNFNYTSSDLGSWNVGKQIRVRLQRPGGTFSTYRMRVRCVGSRASSPYPGATIERIFTGSVLTSSLGNADVATISPIAIFSEGEMTLSHKGSDGQIDLVIEHASGCSLDWSDWKLQIEILGANSPFTIIEAVLEDIPE